MDFNAEDGLASYDSLVALLQVLSRQNLDQELTDYLTESFFQHVLLQANVPDTYDETLSTSESTSCNDLLGIVAQITRKCPQTIGGLRQLLTQPLTDESSMDVRHVSLCFASETLEVNEEALCLAAVVSAQTNGLSSPLLVADSLRFFRRVCARGVLLSSDTAQIFRVVLGLLSQMATDSQVVEEGLAVLTEMSKSADSRVLFAAHFQEVWSNPRMPLALVCGFCRCLRNGADVAELLDTCYKSMLHVWGNYVTSPSAWNRDRGDPLQL